MDASDSTAGIAGFVILILINATLSAALSSLINARRPQLRDMADEGNRRAQRVLALAEDSTPLLVSRQFVNILAHFLAAALVTLSVAGPLIALLVERGISFDTARLIVYPLVWLLGAMLMLIFGEQIPAALASARPERLAMAFVGPITILLRILSPISLLVLSISSRLAASVGGKASISYVTEEEIKTLVDAGSEEGVIEDEEKEMIYSIFQFSDKVAREVMVPRIDIVALSTETPIRTALDTILAVGHSRIPVFEGTIDRIAGLLYAKDLLTIWRDGDDKVRTVGEIMRPAYFVPESKRAGALLEELQLRKIHMAIVIDEYGGTAGLVTIEDLLEEIVGEIQDEYDRDEEAEYAQISEDEYLFDAGIDLDDVNELMDVDLSTEESETLGGYVLSVLGRVPLVGDKFEAEGVEITVEAITGRRIRKVRIRRLPMPGNTESPRAASDREPLAEPLTPEDQPLNGDAKRPANTASNTIPPASVS
jgi:putative hemolysin